jgi:putative endonuclease
MARLMFYVYILERSDGKFYIGQTNNLSNRIIRHQTGQVRSTKAFRPMRLVYSEQYVSRANSVQRESYLKSLKSHKAVEDIIKSDGDGLIV